MAIKNPAIPRPPESSMDSKVDDYMRADSKMVQSFVKDTLQQVNWQVISADPTETPERVPTVKLDTRGWLWIYYNNAWHKYPMNDIAEDVTFDGNLTLGEKQLIGGIGAESTGGTLDWNHVTNARSGNGYTLLVGNATNGPGPAYYYHAFSFEYLSKDGSGGLTQLAIPYSTAATIRNAPVFYRGRYSSTWTPWKKLTPETVVNTSIQNHSTYCRYGSPSSSSWRVWAPGGIEVYDAYKKDPRIVYPSAEQCALTASGASGLDTGSEAASTRYFVHVIHNPVSNLTKTMFSLSNNSPTLPSGYTHFNVVDTVYNNSSSNLILHQRWGDEVWLYSPYQIFYNITSPISFTAYAWPTGMPYNWWTKVFLRPSRATNNAPIHQFSSYAGIAWAQYGDRCYNYDVNRLTRYHNGHTELPIYSRASSVYHRSGWTTTANNQSCCMHGYIAPLYR